MIVNSRFSIDASVWIALIDFQSPNAREL